MIIIKLRKKERELRKGRGGQKWEKDVIYKFNLED